MRLELLAATREFFGTYKPEITGVMARFRAGLNGDWDPLRRQESKAFQAGVHVRNGGMGVAHSVYVKVAQVGEHPTRLAARAAFRSMSGTQRVVNKLFANSALKLLSEKLASGDFQAIGTDLRENLPHLCAHETAAMIALLRQYPEAYESVMVHFLGRDGFDYLTNPSRVEPAKKSYAAEQAPELLAAVKLIAAFEPDKVKLAVWRIRIELAGADWPSAIKTGLSLKLAQV